MPAIFLVTFSKATRCLPITSLINGVVKSTGNRVGDVTKINCERGHDLRGNGKLHCVQPLNGNSQWNRPVPTCERMKPHTEKCSYHAAISVSHS